MNEFKLVVALSLIGNLFHWEGPLYEKQFIPALVFLSGCSNLDFEDLVLIVLLPTVENNFDINTGHAFWKNTNIQHSTICCALADTGNQLISKKNS